MKKSLMGVVAACAALLSTGALAQTANLKFALPLPAQTPFVTEALEPWVEDVVAASNGAVNIQMFPGGSLVRSPDSYYGAVRDNVTEIGFIVGAYTPGLFPDEMLLELPAMVENPYEASVAFWRLHEQGLLRGYDDVKVLGFMAGGPNNLMLTRPVENLDQIAGKQLRVSGSSQTAIVEALSAVAVSNVGPTQAAESMSRGLIEGTLNTWASAAAFRIDRVTRQAIEYPLGFTIITIAMNKSVWEGLSEEAKAAFEAHSGEALSERMGQTENWINDGQREAFLADGTRQIWSVSEEEGAQWRTQFEPVIQRWISQSEDNQRRYDALQSELEDLRATTDAQQ